MIWKIWVSAAKTWENFGLWHRINCGSGQVFKLCFASLRHRCMANYCLLFWKLDAIGEILFSPSMVHCCLWVTNPFVGLSHSQSTAYFKRQGPEFSHYSVDGHLECFFLRPSSHESAQPSLHENGLKMSFCVILNLKVLKVDLSLSLFFLLFNILYLIIN